MDENTLPIPDPKDSYERFAIRAHRELMSRVKDPDERNTIVRYQWDRNRGPLHEDEIAKQAFARDRYEHKPDVCVFAEHEAIDGNGEHRNYDLKEMARIARSCNTRIRDYDGFSPISDGHTPEPDEDRPEPEVLGYSGPFRLGMIGREKPRWAIFADEWHMKHTADRLAGKPRRSVELWTFKNDPSKTHFDPIAAIGSETPRLGLPVKFRRQEYEGATVERYQFAAPAAGAPALPGGGNTHIKKFAKEESTSMLTNEDLSQLMSALMETPQFQYIDQMMRSDEREAIEEEVEPEGYAHDEELMLEGEEERGGGNFDNFDEVPGEGIGEEPLPPRADAPELAGGKAAVEEEVDEDVADLADLIVPPEEEEEMPYMRQKHTRGGGATNGRPAKNGRPTKSETVAVTRYRRLEEAHNRLVAEHGQMAKHFHASQRKASDAERTAAVLQLASEYPEFVDVDAELDTVLYSRKSEMSDEAFGQHLAIVQKYAQKSDMVARSQRPDLPMGSLARAGRPADAQSEKYAADLATEAVRLHTKAVNAGKTGYTYSDAREEAAKKLEAANAS